MADTGHVVVQVQAGIYLHQYSFAFFNEPGTGMEVRLIAPDRTVVAAGQQIPDPSVEIFFMSLQAMTTHDELEIWTHRFDVWPSYPHRDLMDMARWMFPRYFRKERDDGDDDE